MKVLIDSPILIWMSGEPRKLSAKARTLLEDNETEILFSAASAWELVIKESLNKLHSSQKILSILARAEKEFSISRLNISDVHLSKLAKLPFHHRDPFDRLLIAQAIGEKLPVISADANFNKYKLEVIW